VERESAVNWYRAPTFFRELPPAFERATVGQLMREGVLTCRPETGLRLVAQAMAANHVHCMVVTRVTEGSEPDLVGIVTDRDLVGAAAQGVEDRTAGDAARSAVVVGAADPAQRAAELMGERDTSHLLVVDEDVRPIGVVSTLDVAATIAWGLG
jgi:CBS domain-containing protein